MMMTMMTMMTIPGCASEGFPHFFSAQPAARSSGSAEQAPVAKQQAPADASASIRGVPRSAADRAQLASKGGGAGVTSHGPCPLPLKRSQRAGWRFRGTGRSRSTAYLTPLHIIFHSTSYSTASLIPQHILFHSIYASGFLINRK